MENFFVTFLSPCTAAVSACLPAKDVRAMCISSAEYNKTSGKFYIGLIASPVGTFFRILQEDLENVPTGLAISPI